METVTYRGIEIKFRRMRMDAGGCEWKAHFTYKGEKQWCKGVTPASALAGAKFTIDYREDR